MEVVNVDPEVMFLTDNVLTGDISAPVIGQLALELMINPPKPGDPSHDVHARVKENASLHQDSCVWTRGGVLLSSAELLF